MAKHRICLLLLTLLCSVSSILAQAGRDMPQWVMNKPAANVAHNYYYRVTMGEGSTYDKAYAAAFAKAMLEASMKMGVRVTASADESEITSEINKKISMEDYTMEIPINKVCDFWEEVYSPKRIRLYVLWQVAESALKDPIFDEFNNCE